MAIQAVNAHPRSAAEVDERSWVPPEVTPMPLSRNVDEART